MQEGLLFVVLIVLIGCSTGIITSYFKSKKRISSRDLKRVNERIERLEQRMSDDALEERVRALEAIVTDERRRLDQEIRRL